MSNDPGINNAELHAFIDGELDPARTAEIARLLAIDADLAKQVAALRTDKEQIDRIFGKLVELPVPSKLVRMIEESAWERPPLARSYLSRRAIASAVAASPLVVLGFWLGYRRLAASQDDTIVAEAFAARRETMRPEQSFTDATLSAPERRNDVLATALEMTLRAPNLAKLGYRLASIRVYAGVPGGRAVELGYRNMANRLFTLYVRHPSGPARVDLDQRDGVRICIWQDDVLGTVMLGEMSAGEMARIASLAYTGLTA